MSNPHLSSQYVSPNIVIVPTVSFCDPPMKKRKLLSLHDVTMNKIDVASAVNASTNDNTCERQCSNMLDNSASVAITEKQCNTPHESEFTIGNQVIQSLAQPNTVTTAANHDKQSNQDVDISFSNADCDRMVKKTLSWASNYLRSIGQYPPNKKHYQPKRFQQDTNPKNNKEIENLQTTHSSVKSTNDMLNKVNNKVSQKKTVCDVFERLSSKSIAINKTKPIKINLLTEKDKSNNGISEEDKPQVNDSETSRYNNTVPKSKTENNIISLPDRKTFEKLRFNKEHMEKTKIISKSLDIMPSRSKPLTKTFTERKDSAVEKKPLKHCYLTNKHKANLKTADDIPTKYYKGAREKDFSSSKHDKHRKTDHSKNSNNCSEHSSKFSEINCSKQEKKCDTSRNKNIVCLDKRRGVVKEQSVHKIIKKSNEADRGSVKRQTSTPLKSKVQITENFDFNVSPIHKQDLRNKLKRKHSNNNDEKREHLLIAVHNENTVDSKNLYDKRQNVDKQGNVDCNAPKQRQEKRKYKKIKLVINLEIDKCSDSSESETDIKSNECPIQANIDLSFLDDFNVDDIVECLSPDAKKQINLNVNEPIKLKEILSTETMVSKSVDIGIKEPTVEEKDIRINEDNSKIVTQPGPNNLIEDIEFCNYCKNCKQKDNNVNPKDESTHILYDKQIKEEKEIKICNVSESYYNIKKECGSAGKHCQLPRINVTNKYNECKVDTNIDLIDKIVSPLKIETSSESTMKDDISKKNKDNGNIIRKENINVDEAKNCTEIITISESEDEECYSTNINKENKKPEFLEMKVPTAIIDLVEHDEYNNLTTYKDENFPQKCATETSIETNCIRVETKKPLLLNLDADNNKTHLDGGFVPGDTKKNLLEEENINSFNNRAQEAQSLKNIWLSPISIDNNKNIVNVKTLQDDGKGNFEILIAPSKICKNIHTNDSVDKYQDVADKSEIMVNIRKEDNEELIIGEKAQVSTLEDDRTRNNIDQIICLNENNVNKKTINCGTSTVSPKDTKKGNYNEGTASTEIQVCLDANPIVNNNETNSKNEINAKDNNLLNNCDTNIEEDDTTIEKKEIKTYFKVASEKNKSDQNKLDVKNKPVKKLDMNCTEESIKEVPNFDLPVSRALLKLLYDRMQGYFGFQYNMTHLIRSGKFSKVFQCQDLQGRVYALKVTHNNQMRKVPDWLKEDMLKSLQREIPKSNFHCIYLIDGFAARSHWCYLMEYYPNNLQIALADNGKSFHIDQTQKLARQLISAVLVLRNKHIAHLGINPQHILLNSTNDKLKLAGFDEAQYLDGISVVPNVGTVSYRPPEVILGYPDFLKVDVWATGLILYEMATNKKLFPGCYNNDILFKQQCTFGSVPLDMVYESLFRTFHYSGMYFLRNINKKKRTIVHEFQTTDRLRTTLFNAYANDWKKSRNKKDIIPDKIKLGLLNALLDEMLVLHPRDRLPIEFAYTNQFVYESFDSSLWR